MTDFQGTDPQGPERTAGGVAGKLIGKAKEFTGRVTGEDHLAREGRLQQAQADAEAVAETHRVEEQQLQAEQELAAAQQENELERQRLATKIAADDREAALERERQEAERATVEKAQREAAAVEQRRQVQEQAAASKAREAIVERNEELRDAARLEQEARRAEASANALDSEAN